MATTVTSQIQGITISESVKAPVHAVSTVPLTLSGLQTVGGVILNGTTLKRVLVKDQVDTTQNGIYDASSSSWTRSKDFDGNRDVVQGTIVLTSINSDLVYRVTTANPIIIGTGNIVFELSSLDLTQSEFNAFLALSDPYKRTAAEIAASVTPTNYAYPPGDLRRYGCDVTGATDNSTQIENAILAAVAAGGVGYILHPGGNIAHASQITIQNSLTVLGLDRATCIFTFTGTPSGSPSATRSAWRYSGPVNSSGFANVAFRHVKIVYQNTVNFAAAIELNAGGWSYWEIDDVWIRGGCSYGLILDAVEIISVHNCLIENQNATTAANIWVVNGSDRTTSQSTGFTNVLTIRDNQISGNGGIGIVDDGGNEHWIAGNNFNEHRFPVQCSAVNELTFIGNSLETTLQTGSSNMLLTNLSLSGATVGPCTNGVIHSNGFFGNVSASGSLLAFSGAMHTAFHITGNQFGNQLGRGAAIDVTKLSGSFCGYNSDLGTVSMFHYTGVHNDADGNTLFPPQSGAPVTWNVKGVTYGDQRSPLLFSSATIKKLVTVPYTVTNGVTGITFNAAAGDSFDLTVTNATAFTINAPLGDAPAYDFWNQSTVYAAGKHVVDATNQNVYVCTVGGTSAAAGTGPSGTGTGISDNTVTWNYVSGTTSTLTAGQQITLHINNTSGGAMGAITWNAVFKMSAWTNPANGQNRSITFEYNGSSWKQISQTGADIPN